MDLLGQSKFRWNLTKKQGKFLPPPIEKTLTVSENHPSINGMVD